MEGTNSGLDIIKNFFEAGPIEVGLEVGADSGLSIREYIQVPKQCHKEISYKLSDETMQTILEDTDSLCDLKCKILQVYRAPETPDPDDLEVDEWLPFDSKKQKLAYYLGRIWVLDVGADGFLESLSNDSNPVSSLSSEPWSSDDYKAFICVNIEASEKVSDTTKGFFHACRLLSLLFGVGLTDHDKEWNVVENPSKIGIDAVDDSEIAELTKVLRWAPTAICVRAAMFRKTKHATGGSIAQGFTQKIINQMSWPFADDAQKRRSTNDFYLSTHAASPVGRLAMISPKDMGHFGIINPLCGIRGTLKSLSSVSLRVVAPDQI